MSPMRSTRKLPADHYTLASVPGHEVTAHEELYVAVGLLPESLAAPVERGVLRPATHPPIVHCKYEFPMGAKMRVMGVSMSGGIVLSTRMASGPLPVGPALTLAERVCRALALGHAHGAVHGHVGTGKIFLPGADPGGAKLLDFDFTLQPGRDPDADIFALGRVLFECLTGDAPDAGAAPRLSEHMSKVPPALEALVGRVLNDRSGERPANAEELASELASLRRSVR